jgi:hypothetical protein
MVNNGKAVAANDKFTGEKIWFQAQATCTNFTANFSFSIDGEKFLPIGDEFEMGQGLHYTPNRFALFNFSTSDAGVGGCADFNWFHFSSGGPR